MWTKCLVKQFEQKKKPNQTGGQEKEKWKKKDITRYHSIIELNNEQPSQIRMRKKKRVQLRLNQIVLNSPHEEEEKSKKRREEKKKKRKMTIKEHLGPTLTNLTKEKEIKKKREGEEKGPVVQHLGLTLSILTKRKGRKERKK
jgi:hypothetical protein